MSDLNFLKDLLKINQDNFAMSSKDRKKMEDFQKGLKEGFLSKFKPEEQEVMKELWKEKNLSKLIDGLDENKDVDLIGMTEAIIDKFSEEDVFTHNDVSIDPADLFNKYQQLKAKHKKYEESEDINNF